MDDGVFLHLATMDVPTKLDAGILGKGKKGERSRTAGIVRTRVCGHKTGVLKPENLGWNCRNSRRCSWEAPR